MSALVIAHHCSPTAVINTAPLPLLYSVPCMFRMTRAPLRLRLFLLVLWSVFTRSQYCRYISEIIMCVMLSPYCLSSHPPRHFQSIVSSFWVVPSQSHSFIHFIIPSSIYPLIESLMHWFIGSLTNSSYTHTFIHQCINLSIDNKFTRSFFPSIHPSNNSCIGSRR